MLYQKQIGPVESVLPSSLLSQYPVCCNTLIDCVKPCCHDSKYHCFEVMKHNYIVSFIGFLPADKPEAVVYVAIDNPKGVTQFGGTVSAPIAKNIMYDIIDELKIKTSEYTLDKTYNWYDVKYAKVPNVLNMNIDDAKKELKKFTVNYSGTGSIIKMISPSPGTYLPENATIKILLSN